MELIEKEKGENIFPKTPIGTDQSNPVLHAVEKGLRLKALDEKIAFISPSLRMCSSQQMVIYFLDRAFELLNDAVLFKIVNTFFGVLPHTNILTTHATKSAKEKPRFERQLDSNIEYYSANQYSEPWRKTCRTTCPEFLAVGIK